MFIKFIRFIGLALILAVLISSTQTHSGYELIADTEIQAKQLSEISKLRAENFKLKLQLIQCEITGERSTLENLFKKELNAQESDQFNWNSLSLNSSISK